MTDLLKTCCFCILLLCPALQAEQIQIPVGQQTGEQALPQRGDTQTQVAAHYGQPLERSTVGQPPISRWRYPDFSVYFEDEYVLHSVYHFRAKHPITP